MNHSNEKEERIVLLRRRILKLELAIDSEPPSLFRNELESTYEAVKREYNALKGVEYESWNLLH